MATSDNQFVLGRKILAFKAGHRPYIQAHAFTSTARLQHHPGPDQPRQWRYRVGERVALHTGIGRTAVDQPATVTEVFTVRVGNLTKRDLVGGLPDQLTPETVRIAMSNAARRLVADGDEVTIIRFEWDDEWGSAAEAAASRADGDVDNLPF